MTIDDVVSDDSKTGKPWTVVATFSDFAPAAAKADQLRSSSNLQVKVKRIAAGFTVRTRQIVTASADPAPAKQGKPRTKAKDRRAKETETEE